MLKSKKEKEDKFAAQIQQTRSKWNSFALLNTKKTRILFLPFFLAVDGDGDFAPGSSTSGDNAGHISGA